MTTGQAKTSVFVDRAGVRELAEEAELLVQNVRHAGPTEVDRFLRGIEDKLAANTAAMA
jgi:hypothetical protein